MMSSGKHDNRFTTCRFDAQNIESVKKFLLAYCRLRKQEGFIVLHDSLSAFYEAICAGMSEPEEPSAISVSQCQGTDLGNRCPF